MDVPAEHDLHHQRHGVHVDARHQDGHDGEGNSAERARAFAIAQLKIAGDGVGFGNVVERHHDQRQEDDGGKGGDPVGVRGENSVLISGRGPTHQLNGAEVGGDEAQPRDPCRHFAARHEEVFAARRIALQVHADAEHDDEIDGDNRDVGGAERDEARGVRKKGADE